jgi:hypothetical protein
MSKALRASETLVLPWKIYITRAILRLAVQSLISSDISMLIQVFSYHYHLSSFLLGPNTIF